MPMTILPGMVVCPKCNGTGLNPYGACAVDPTCRVCKGSGSITKRHREVLRAVSADIQAELRRRGIEL